MKKLFFFSSLLTLAVFIVFSCSKDDDFIDKILEPTREYHDKFFNTRWISVSDKDSVILEFECWQDTSFSSIWIDMYDYVGNTAQYRTSEHYMRGYVPQKNELLLAYYSSGNPNNKDRTLSFDLNNDKLVIHNFEQGKEYTFYKEFLTKEYPAISTLSGVWSAVLNKDSTVVVFENGGMKEYVYDKNSGEILKYTDYNKYFLYRKVFTWQKQTYNQDRLWLYIDNEIAKMETYSLQGNKLVIYKNENPVTYHKVKD